MTQNERLSRSRDIFESLLKQRCSVTLPEIRDREDWRNVIQNQQLVDFNEYQRVDNPNSVVDFILRKGGHEVLVGITDGWLKLTPEQRDRIESAGKSFLIFRADLITDWSTAHYYSKVLRDIKHELLGTVREEIEAAYWVYHSKHGWQNGAQ